MTIAHAPSDAVMAAAQMAVDAPTAANEPAAGTGTGKGADGPSGAIWDALTANPGASVAVIAAAAGMSKNLARKALRSLEEAGHATRSAGGREGGKRLPDTWNPTAGSDDADTTTEVGTATAHQIDSSPEEIPVQITETAAEAAVWTTDDRATSTEVPTEEATDGGPAVADDADTCADTEDSAEAAVADTGAEQVEHGNSDPTASTESEATLAVTAPEEATQEARAGELAEEGPLAEAADEEVSGTDEAQVPAEAEQNSGEELMDPVALGEAYNAMFALSEANDAVMQALADGDRQAALAAVEKIYSGSARVRRSVRAAVSGRARSVCDRPKSAPGELRGKVEAHLAEYPGEDFTPHQIGKVIGHSAGAVANALDRLVALGKAVETSERPRRFTAAPPTNEAADATATAGGLQGATH